jgi:hypothetical protein
LCITRWGKGYSPAGLAKRGISYEKDRDVAAIGRQREREEHRRPGHADSDAARGEDRERGSTGVDAGADRAGDGRTGGGNASYVDGDRAEKSGVQRDVRAADRGRGADGAQRSGDVGAISRPHESGQPAHGIDALPPSVSDGPLDCGPRERILALASPADRSEPVGRGAGSRAPEARDRSLEAVKAQIGAMGAERYEVLITNARTGAQIKRVWRAPEILESVAWLKRLNAQSADIYVRPIGGPELLLVESLDAGGVDELDRKGLSPASTTETSDGQFQAWVKLSDRPLPKALRQQAVLALAGALPSIAEYGRLAGFTNQQIERNGTGRHPYVLSRASTGRIAPAAHAYLAAIEKHLRDHGPAKQRRIDVEKVARAPQRDRGRSR